jgi:hypothetical protein
MKVMIGAPILRKKLHLGSTAQPIRGTPSVAYMLAADGSFAMPHPGLSSRPSCGANAMNLTARDRNEPSPYRPLPEFIEPARPREKTDDLPESK